MIKQSIRLSAGVAGLFSLAIAASIPGEVAAWQESVPPAATADAPATATAPDAGASRPAMSFFELLTRGGFLMWPLLALSILGVTLTLERAIALRKERILPQKFIREISRQAELPGGFDPRVAYRLCQTLPCSASRILRAMLLKTGRPQGEIEHAINEAVQREANRLQAPVSWLGLTAAVAPLIGLLGTVWGITEAFFQFTQIPNSQNPGAALATGIYTALVTTLAGLMIAIPSAVAAHFFENRITGSLNDVEEMFANLLPQLERYEGRVRFTPPNEKSLSEKSLSGSHSWREGSEIEAASPEAGVTR